MKKALILRNLENGKFYTGDYRDNFWSKDDNDARWFNDDSAIQKEIESQKETDEAFGGIKNIEMLTIIALSEE